MAQVTKSKGVISGIKETLERQRTQMELGASFVVSYGEDALLDEIEENKLRDAIAQVTQSASDFSLADIRQGETLDSACMHNFFFITKRILHCLS